jgi:exosortase D (VPLPA-CTERM-specific)
VVIHVTKRNKGERIPELLPIVAVFACFGASFGPVFPKLLRQWSTGDNDYCYLILPLFLYLCWERRRTFRFADLSWAAGGLGLLCAALALTICGEIASAATVLYSGLWAAVVALAFLFYGPRVKQLAFPLLILLFIVPLPPFINQVLTFKLKLFSSAIAVRTLEALGVGVFREGSLIDFGFGQLEVVDACSGLRYLIPTLLTALLTAHFFAVNRWHKLAIIGLALPLSLAVNVVRIVGTGLLMDGRHHQLAEGFYHDFFGWLIFVLVVVLLVLLGRAFRRSGGAALSHMSPAAPVAGMGRQPSVLFITLTCTALLAAGWALRLLPTATVVPQRSAFSSFPMLINDWHGERRFLPQPILDSLWADDYLSAVYQKPGENRVLYLFIPYYGSQTTYHTAHAPESCLLGGGWSILTSVEREVTMPSGLPIAIQELSLEKQGFKVLAAHFFLQHGKALPNPVLNKFYLAWSSIIKGRSDGALVRMEMALLPGQSIESARELMEDFLVTLWGILPAYVPS